MEKNIQYELKNDKFPQDCPSGSLDTLDLPALITAASKSALCFIEARSSFKRVYSRSKFYIEGPFVDGTNAVTETNKQLIQIKNLNAALNTMKLFGDMVQYVDVSYSDLSEDEGSSIGEYIVENCATSLIELNLKNCYGTVLNKLQKPFPNINNTIFSTHQVKAFDVAAETLTLDKMYPSLKRLNVNVANVNHWKIVGDKFPHLRALTVVIPRPEYTNFPDIAKLLNESRSINSLALTYSSLDLLRRASQVLPQLKVLQLNEFADNFYEGEKIEFKNVSMVRITSTRKVESAQVPESLAFKHLQSLSLSLSASGLSDKWINFFEQPKSQSVESLELSLNGVLSNQLTAIARHQPHLNSVVIKSEKTVPSDEIVSFLENSEHLTWLVLQSGFIDVAELSILEGRLQPMWLIEYIDLNAESSRIRFIR